MTKIMFFLFPRKPFRLFSQKTPRDRASNVLVVAGGAAGVPARFYLRRIVTRQSSVSLITEEAWAFRWSLRR